MPPAPILAMTRYEPSRLPGCSDMTLLRTDSVQLLFRDFCGGALFGASPTEDTRHGVISLVAGVLEHRTLCLRHRYRGGPRSCPRRGICHGELVPDGVRADARKAFDQVYVRAGSSKARLLAEIRGLNDQRRVLPTGISDLPALDGPFIHPKAAQRPKLLFVTASSRFRGRQLSPW